MCVCIGGVEGVSRCVCGVEGCVWRGGLCSQVYLATNSVSTANKHRVFLSGEQPNYIHAVSANVSAPKRLVCVFHIPTSQGYKHQKAYIIAEGPMASTVRNMWKLVYDQKCGTLVMLSKLIENGMVCFNQKHLVCIVTVFLCRRAVGSTGQILLGK